jgi:hypothetical protein
MIKHILFKNGKEYLTVSSKNWNNYLNQVSPLRSSDQNNNCGLKNIKTSKFCNTCNKPLGKFSESCVNIITRTNLREYSKILFGNSEKIENVYYEIEIYNDDNISFP